MKRITLLAITVVAAVSLATPTMAQNNGNRKATAIKIKQLETKKTTLEQRILAEDKKRNQVIAGMRHDALEELNIRQDSVCLALRSQLVDVNLAIKELKNNK